MNGVAMLLIASYLIAVLLGGNRQALWSELVKDAPGFMPWFIAAVALVFIWRNRAYTGVAAPWVESAVVLGVLATVLKSADAYQSVIETFSKALSSAK